MIWQWVVVTILSAVACFHSSSHAQAVRISYSGLSGQNLPFWVTYDAGLKPASCFIRIPHHFD